MFSLNHSCVGRSTHGSGTAGAHMEYVTRESACTVVMGQNMPVPRPGRVRRTRAWIDRQEQADRKNARVIDKIMLALPRDLDAERRVELIRRFAQELTGGQTPWLAAFHDKGKDQHNPHCHFVLRDRHVDTGKRVVGMSEKGSTERVRRLWERLANDALARAGSATRIDRRSLAAQRADKLDQAARCQARDPDRAATLRAEAQDLDRAPQAHLGPKARAVKAEGRHSTKIARIEEAQEARRRAERAQEARKAREAARRAQEAETALRAAQIAAESRERARREEEGAAERRRAALEARKAWEAAQGAKRADSALTAAQDALRASQGELGRAARNRDAAAEILAGRRELMTGRPKPTGEPYALPPRAGPRPTEEEIAEAEHQAFCCDDDGHECIPYPPPIPQDHGDDDAYRSARAAWEDAERARIERAAREKHAAWTEHLPELRRRLGATERAQVVLAQALEAARSIFDWMRERVATARGTLGADHETAQAMQADWLDAIADHPRTHGAVRTAALDRARDLDRQADPIWDEGARLWQEVEHRRRHRPDHARRYDPGPGGPSGP